MWIYLLRHGIAEDLRPGIADEDRALTEVGEQRLRKASAAWRKLVAQPSLVVTSPLVRARQTASAFAEAVSFEGELQQHDGLVPHAPMHAATALLEGELLSGTECVALVGHEPHLGYLLGSLLTGHPRMSVPLKKGMLVGLQTESPSNLVVGLRFALTQKHAARMA